MGQGYNLSEIRTIGAIGMEIEELMEIGFSEESALEELKSRGRYSEFFSGSGKKLNSTEVYSLYKSSRENITSGGDQVYKQRIRPASVPTIQQLRELERKNELEDLARQLDVPIEGLLQPGTR